MAKPALAKSTYVKRTRKQTPAWVPAAYLSPALLTIAIFSVGPILYTIYLSMTNFNLNHFDQFEFVGLKNYIDIFTGPYLSVYKPVFVWTFVYAIASTLITYAVGLFLALLLNNPRMKETNLYRAILVIPWGLPPAIAILAWKGLFNGSFGQINMLLGKFGIHAIPWLTDPVWAKVAIVITTLWIGYPFMMNVGLGALQAIPRDLYESADIDGASMWKKFWHVTFPGLMSSTLPLLISSFAYNFNNFGAAFLITEGGPPRPDTQFAGYTDILVSSAYSLTNTFNRYDLASALSMILFVVIGILSFLNMKYTRAFEEVD